jgi:hypothetical protein
MSSRRFWEKITQTFNLNAQQKEITIMARGYGKGGNSSGRGPVGKAPASRAPIKAAVKPTTPNRNPNAQGGPVRTGGGVGSNKHVMVKPVGGSPSTRKTSPDTVSDLGRAWGNHVMGSANGGTVQRKDPPLHVPAQAPALHGNRLAFDEAATSGRACVGVGRTTHPSGSQSTYSGENNPGTINKDRTIAPAGSGNAGTSIKGTADRSSPFLNRAAGGQGPGSLGFKGPGK